MTFHRTAVFCGLVLSTAGCATQAPLTTRPLAPGATITGMPYYLLKSFLRISFEEAKVLDAEISVENRPDLLRGQQVAAAFSTFSNDKVVVETSADGLLKSVSVDTDDQSNEIVTGLTSRVTASLAGGDASIQSGAGQKAAFSILVDPFDDIVRTKGRDLNGVTVKTAVDETVFNETNGTTCPIDAALCVPLLVPVTITLELEGVDTKVEHVVTVAHPRHVMGLRIDRHSCVNSKSVFTFAQGMITKIDVDKPSEVAGCLSIPLDVISAIVAAPLNALTGRNARLQAEKGVVEQQRLLLEAQQNLIAAQSSAAGSE